jgi:hypothetical protein
VSFSGNAGQRQSTGLGAEAEQDRLLDGKAFRFAPISMIFRDERFGQKCVCPRKDNQLLRLVNDASRAKAFGFELHKFG